MPLQQFMCDIMCAKKRANFALWLTIWLSFQGRKIFLETVVQILLICVCHFSCSSTVTPSRRCFETCSIGVVSKFRFKGSCCFWCFCLVDINMHFVLVGFSCQHTERQSDRQTDRQTNGRTDRPAGMQAGRQAGRQTDRQTDSSVTPAERENGQVRKSHHYTW